MGARQTQLNGSEYLYTSAEVAAALAGFATLAIVLRPSGNEALSPFHRSLVASIIERGLVCVLLAFLPALLEYFSLSTQLNLNIASGFLAAYILSLIARTVRGARANPVARTEIVSFWLYVTLIVLGFGIGVLQILHIAGALGEPNIAWYLLGLTWLLASVCYRFYFIVRSWVRAA